MNAQSARSRAGFGIETLRLHSAVLAFSGGMLSEIYAAFQQAAADRDVALASNYLAEDVRLFASLTSKPFGGKSAVLAVLTMLLNVIEDLTYLGEFDNSEGKVILTHGTVKGRQVDGVQVLTVGPDGLIVEFRDFIRPFSGAVALREAAEEYFARLQ